MCDGGLLKTRRTRINGHTGSANQPKPAMMAPDTTKASCTAEPDEKSSPTAAIKAPTGYDAPSSSPKRVTDRGRVPWRCPVELTTITQVGERSSVLVRFGGQIQQRGREHAWLCILACK
jgi:hypothetical protein